LLLGCGRQHNTSALIPQFVDKNVASKDVFGVGASSSQIGIFHHKMQTLQEGIIKST